MAVICAFITVTIFTLQGQFQPEVAEAQKQPAVRLNEIVLLSMSLLLAALYRFGWAGPVTMLRLGHVFQVAVAFSLAWFENSMPWNGDQPIRGMSALAVWIVASSLFIPGPPILALAAAVLSAAMGPLAHYLSLSWYGFPALPTNRLLILYVPPFLVAFCSWFMSRLVIRMESTAQRAKELGSYELEDLLGKGGMGEVWRARHRLLKRQSAVKLIRGEVLVAQTGRQADVLKRRFEQEAQATAALTSPHTVSLFDFGVDDGGNFFYAMELLKGLDLEQLVKRFGPQPAARVAHILRQACDSLEEAHRQGIVHRDIKPTNLYLCRLGVQYDFCKLLDFGLAKWRVSNGDGRMTMESVTTGTPAFMAPELAMGSSDVDGRTDLYGLGCVAYWLLTGKLVFDEPTPTAMALAHVQKPPIPPSQLTELPVSDGLERIILACLAKKPPDRPTSARMVREQLEECSEASDWSPDAAERWWKTNLPEIVSAQDSITQQRAEVLEKSR